MMDLSVWLYCIAALEGKLAPVGWSKTLLGSCTDPTIIIKVIITIGISHRYPEYDDRNKNIVSCIYPSILMYAG